MARIRIPDTAKDLLPFCKAWRHLRENACFQTYARLVSFAACYGYKQKPNPSSHKNFINPPDPIEYQVLKNENLHHEMLILTIKRLDSVEDAQKETAIIRAIEDYSALGFKAMKVLLDKCGPNSFPDELGREIIKSGKIT